MKIVLIIILIICLFLIKNYKKKIDEEEKIALNTPGTASRLRENFGDVIELILQSKNNKILFERSYDESIRIGNSNNQELFMSYSNLGSNKSELRVTCVQDSMVLKEWTFNNNRSSISIYQEIIDYFN